MIFSEVIEQILFERGIDHKELATELGISAPQVRNLHLGITKMPSDRVCNKIVQYCKKYDVDIDINWNDILYDIFISSESFRGYSWIRDMDEDGYVVVKHKECGRKTYVPKDAFGNKSVPCIHCWVDRYVSADVYETNLSEDSDRHRFTHKCGHSYYVTYNEIKQKKFRCPDCTGYRYNSDNLSGSRSNISTHGADVTSPPVKPIVPHRRSPWDGNLKARLDRIAGERGFSIEDRDSIHCRLHYHAMTDQQFAMVCNSCFDSEVFDKNEKSISKVLDYANHHKNECEKYNDCLIENTERHNIAWIPDVENILSMVALSAPEDNPFFELIERLQNGDYSKTVYTAGAYNPEDDKTAYLFYHYTNDNDATDFVNFLVSIAPTRFGEMTFHAFPKVYTDALYEQIQRSMTQRVANTTALQKSCDEYIDIVNYFKQNNPQIFVYAALGKFANNLSKILEKPTPLQRRDDTEKMLSMLHCPVCHALHNSKAEVCTNCGFDELNRVFINKDEYELWLNEIVLPARQRRENNE